jgi:hypothetical protein
MMGGGVTTIGGSIGGMVDTPGLPTMGLPESDPTMGWPESDPTMGWPESDPTIGLPESVPTIGLVVVTICAAAGWLQM